MFRILRLIKAIEDVRLFVVRYPFTIIAYCYPYLVTFYDCCKSNPPSVGCVLHRIAQ